MTILARTGKARWCSRCGKSWTAHMWRPIVNYKTGQKLARCIGAEWTTRGRAKRIRQAERVRHAMIHAVEAWEKRP